MTMEQAVSAAKLNKPEGQSCLYEHTYKKAYYVALKFMQNEDDAYDVVQDSYMRAFKNKKPDLFSDIAGDDETNVADRFEADYKMQPETVVDRNETSRLVQEIIRDLSDEQRACVIMYYMQEMSVKEISGILEVSDNTVKSRLKYSRDKIAMKVKELEKKGTKLYSLAPIPFFLYMVHAEADACEAPVMSNFLGNVSAQANTAAEAASSGATSTGSAGTGAGAEVGAGTASSGAAAVGMSLGAKIAIGITAAVLVIGGAIGVGVAVSSNSEDTAINKEVNNTGNKESDNTGNNSQQPEQGEYEDYLSTQNILYGQSINRELCKLQVNYDARNTPAGYKPAGSYYKSYARCVYPTGVLGYVVEDVNDDGKDELIQLDIDSSGNITISEKEKSWGKVKDVGEKRSYCIRGEYNRVAFYTFKGGKDTYLLITSGLDQNMANHSTWRMCCYKFEDDKIIPVVDTGDMYQINTEEDEISIVNKALEPLNKVLGLQGKSMDYNQCLEILDSSDCNIEKYIEAERFILLSMNKTYGEMSSAATQLMKEWNAWSTDYDRLDSEPINESDIIEKVVISSQLITK